MNNYMVLNMAEGVYTYTFNAEKKPDCVACSNTTRILDIKPDAVLMDIFEKLKEDPAYLMKNPGIYLFIKTHLK